MVKAREKIHCKDCGQKLSKEDKICPNCGSKRRYITLIFEEKIELHDQIKGKVKRQRFKKPVQELKVGDDLHRKSGKWYHREIYIDREKNQYKEIVRDKHTGETIHECKEPLSKHVGHGSAKYKKSKLNGNK